MTVLSPIDYRIGHARHVERISDHKWTFEHAHLGYLMHVRDLSEAVDRVHHADHFIEEEVASVG